MASASFDDSNWNGYWEVSSDETKIDEATGDLMIDLGTHAPSDFWSNAASDGGDVRITNSDGSTAYSFELENFDTGAQTGILFFDSQAISTSSSVTFRIYAGNDSASMPADSDTLGSENVWNQDGYDLVYHMNNTPTNPQTDSTANGLDASTYNGSMDSSDLIDGKFGKAISFDGSDDELIGPDDPSLSLLTSGTQGTILAWVSHTSYNDSGHAFGVNESDTDAGEWALNLQDQNGDGVQYSPRFDIYGDNNLDEVSDSLDYNTYYLFGISIDAGTEFTTYVDGSSQGTTPSSTTSSDGGSNFTMGSHRDESFPVDIEEIRIIKGAKKSANWHNTHYNNQSDNASFWTAGSWETGATTETKTHTLDSYLYKEQTSTHSLDSYLWKRDSKTHTLDSSIAIRATESHTEDSYIQYVGIPNWDTPTDSATVDTSTPELVFYIPNSSYKMHFEIQLDTVNTFDSSDLQTIKSWTDQTNWEYYDGNSWVSMPADGVDPSYVGNRCRYTVESSLSETTWYRRVRGRVMESA